MDTLEQSSLFRQLNAEQKNTVQACMVFVEKLWSTDRIIQYYTDHGPQHSLRILEYVEQMPNITEYGFLVRDEIFVLLLGIILHDIGMQCDIRLLEQIRKKAEEDYKISFVENYATNQVLTDKHQQEIRKNHSALAGAWIKKVKIPNDYSSLAHALSNLPGIFTDDLADVCRYHSFYDIQECPYSFKSYPQKRKQLLAALIRLGDELDIDYRRVTDSTIEHIAIPDEGMIHFLLHANTVISINDNAISTYYNLREDDIQLHKNNLQIYHDRLIKKNHDSINILIRHGCSLYFSAPVFLREDSAKRLPIGLFEIDSYKQHQEIPVVLGERKFRHELAQLSAGMNAVLYSISDYDNILKMESDVYTHCIEDLRRYFNSINYLSLNLEPILEMQILAAKIEDLQFPYIFSEILGIFKDVQIDFRRMTGRVKADQNLFNLLLFNLLKYIQSNKKDSTSVTFFEEKHKDSTNVNSINFSYYGDEFRFDESPEIETMNLYYVNKIASAMNIQFLTTSKKISDFDIGLLSYAHQLAESDGTMHQVLMDEIQRLHDLSVCVEFVKSNSRNHWLNSASILKRRINQPTYENCHKLFFNNQ